MPVNTTLASLSQTASLNGPDGSVDAPSTLDDAIRYALSFIAQLRDGYAASNQVFAQNGAKVQRLNDVVRVGGATVSDQSYPNVTKDWLLTYQVAAGLANGTLLNAQTASLTSDSASAAVGFLAGSQSLHFTSAATSCIGSSAYAVNNNTTLATKAWAFYGEAWKLTAASGAVYGMELDVYSTVATVTPHPGQQGDAVGIQLAVGAELTGAVDASVGIEFAANPAKWKKGINFLHDSLTGSSGGVGESCAIAMAMTQNLEWYTSAGSRNGFIKFTTATAANRTGIISNDTGFYISGNAEQPLMLCANIANAVNYPQLIAAVTGQPIQLLANGTDSNIDVWARSKGTGVLRFGTVTANADAPVTGYITIKDDGGSTRKLAVIT
jgi:hypothetical protein